MAPRAPVPESLVNDVGVSGFSDIRFWGDAVPPMLDQRTRRLVELLAEDESDAIAARQRVNVSFLAVSGGGGNGAFGAGFLNGWTQSGTRPEFRVVTGVSTGAIIAPFAFLGPNYDDELRAAYTEIGPDDIYRASILPNLLGGLALGNGRPLEILIARHADDALLAAIAEEHTKGRRLYVTTTNLDAGRPVVWDMGAIAARGRPDALELFRKIILASASLPGLFPPVGIEVTDGTDKFTEYHVDGGLSSQVFAYNAQVQLGRVVEQADFAIAITVYVIWNGRRVPAYHAPDPTWYRLVERAVDVQFSHQGLGDIRRIYSLTQRDGVTFQLAIIPDEFADVPDELFAQDYMQDLFRVGEAAGHDADSWLDEPP
jgi:predicted acylesterase/phospholipase RssA